MNRNIVAGQPIDTEKLLFARQLRRTMTPSEKCLWPCLRGRRLNGIKFRRQQIIDGYIADFYCASIGLVIELDGPIHDSQIDYDELRDRVMAARGLTILRIPNSRIELELKQVLNEIATFAHGPQPQPLVG
jgi:very-short-patch-repair endonuclease